LTPQDEYTKRTEEYSNRCKRLNGQINNISNLRLVVAVLGLGGTIFLYYRKMYSASAVILTISILVFAFLVIHHAKLFRYRKKNEILLKINENAIKRLNG
jgi:membrane protein YdbS with pleckstrin-like domain